METHIKNQFPNSEVVEKSRRGRQNGNVFTMVLHQEEIFVPTTPRLRETGGVGPTAQREGFKGGKGQIFTKDTGHLALTGDNLQYIKSSEEGKEMG